MGSIVILLNLHIGPYRPSIFLLTNIFTVQKTNRASALNILKVCKLRHLSRSI